MRAVGHGAGTVFVSQMQLKINTLYISTSKYIHNLRCGAKWKSGKEARILYNLFQSVLEPPILPFEYLILGNIIVKNRK